MALAIQDPGDHYFKRGCWEMQVWVNARYVPGFQPPFSLNPDPDLNMEVTRFVSVVACCVYIPLSCPIQFCCLSHQNCEGNAKDPPRIPDPWIQDL